MKGTTVRHISQKEREKNWAKDLADKMGIEITDWQAEFIERANKGVISLEHSRSQHPVGSHDRSRLSGKIEGLKLALSWFDEVPK